VSSPAPLRAKLFSDGLFTFAGRIASMMLAAVLGVLTARVLGPHGRGIYAIPMIAAGLVAAVYPGLSLSASFYLLRERAGRGAIVPLTIVAAILVVLGAVVAVAIAYSMHAPWAALPAALSLVGSASVMLVTGYSTGTHRVRYNTTFALYSTSATILSIGAAFLWIARSAPVAIWGWVIATDTIGLALLAWMLSDARRLPPGTPVRVRDMLWYTVKTGSVSLVSLLNYRADLYIVAVMTTPAMLGMYSVAVTAAETLLTVTQVTGVVASPHIGSMDERASAALTARCVRHNVLVSGVCSGALALVAPFAVHVLYGNAFLPVVPAMRVLIAGVFALSLGSPMSTFFTIRLARPGVAFTLASISAIVCAAVSVLLVRRIGLVGAATGSTLGYAISQSLAVWYFSRTSRIAVPTIVLPKAGDVQSYVLAARALLKRARSIDSRARVDVS
jgi:O-antigen/teichoic acid export membrane protein